MNLQINSTTRKAMKLLTFLLFAACVHVNAKSYSQITLSLKNAPLKTVFIQINEQTGFNFLYSDEVLAKTKEVTLNVKNATLENVLELCFRDQPLNYRIVQNTIVVKQKPSTLTSSELLNGFFLLPIDVRGQVLNEKGEPVEAIISVKGAKIQTATDSNGFFELKGIDDDAILVISGVNIESYEIKVNGKTDLSIKVKTKVTTGEEVTIEVNTGYETLPKERATGSFTKINNSTLNQRVGANILNRLEDVTSGVLFDNNINRKKNGGISVRGVSTINSDRSPLIILDNFPYEGNIENINPNDIESITILKDAAAASIWGARAGNGVIVITTKKAALNQKLSIGFTANTIITEKPDLFKLKVLASTDFIDVEQMLFSKGFYDNLLQNPRYPVVSPVVEILEKQRKGIISVEQANQQVDAFRNNDVRRDFDKYFYQKGVQQQYALNLKGGLNNFKYYVSGGYDKVTSTLNAKNERLTFRMDNSLTPLKNLVLNAGIYYATNNSQNGRPGWGDIRSNSLGVEPYLRFADDEGNALAVTKNYRGGYIDTAGNNKLLDWKYYPLDDYKHLKNITREQSLLTSLGLQYTMIKNLNIDIRYQFEQLRSDNRNLSDIQSYSTRDMINRFSQIDRSRGTVTYPVPRGGILYLANNLMQANSLRGQFNYTMTKGRHQISAIAGSELRQRKTIGNTSQTYGYDKNVLTFGSVNYNTLYPDFVNGSSQYISDQTSFSGTVNRFVSFYSNAAYSYSGRYTVSASVRKDQSNLFGVNANEKGVPLWSVGSGWQLSKERFYNLGFLPYLKLKATYGYSGNIDLNRSAVTTLQYLGQGNNTNLPFARIIQYANPDLRWERVAIFNIGIDFETINSVLVGSIEYYRKNSVDLIGQVPIDATTGVGLNLFSGENFVSKNVANMRGNGIDIQMTSKNIDQAFKWSTTALFSYNKNEVTEFKRSTFQAGYGNTIDAVKGKPLFSLLSYKWGGLNTTGNPLGYDNNGRLSTDYNLLVSPKASPTQLVYSGSAIPTIFGSFQNTFQWKGFAVDVNLNYKLGYYFRKTPVHSSKNLFLGVGHPDFYKRWQKPGDELFTNVPAIVYPSLTSRDVFYELSEITALKGDNIRLQYINLNYSLQQKSLAKLPIQKLQVYINVSNLGIIWRANKEELDPDSGNFNSIPLSKTMAVGLRANF